MNPKYQSQKPEGDGVAIQTIERANQKEFLKEEPIDGGIKRRETLMSSIFMKSTCTSKRSMFLCRESHKSNFDAKQESFV